MSDCLETSPSVPLFYIIAIATANLQVKSHGHGTSKSIIKVFKLTVNL